MKTTATTSSTEQHQQQHNAYEFVKQTIIKQIQKNNTNVLLLLFAVLEWMFSLPIIISMIAYAFYTKKYYCVEIEQELEEVAILIFISVSIVVSLLYSITGVSLDNSFLRGLLRMVMVTWILVRLYLLAKHNQHQNNNNTKSAFTPLTVVVSGHKTPPPTPPSATPNDTTSQHKQGLLPLSTGTTFAQTQLSVSTPTPTPTPQPPTLAPTRLTGRMQLAGRSTK